jgi:hypothetical protein
MNRLKGLLIAGFWVLGIPFLHAAVGSDDMHWLWKIGMAIGGLGGLYMIITGRPAPFTDEE